LHWVVEALSGIGFFLVVMHFLDGLDSLGRLLQAMWGGDVRKLKKENKQLRVELRDLRKLASNVLHSDERIKTLETIVTDDDYELNKKLRGMD
jgi:hypothetical protein